MYLDTTLASDASSGKMDLHDDALPCSYLRVDHDDDVERAVGLYEDAAQHIHVDPVERRTTLPPAYESSAPGSADIVVPHLQQHKTTPLDTRGTSS